jgi:hypothetical protein
VIPGRSFRCPAAVALLLAFAGTILGPPARAATTGGAIYLTTLPTGADAWVDGAYVGRTPVLIDALSSGKHTITAAKTGWVSRELHVVVGDRQALQFVDAQLDRDPTIPASDGTLALHARTPIKSVSIDGTAMRPSPGGRLDLAAGDHALVVETPGGRFARHISIYPGTTTNVVVRAGGEGGDQAVVVAPTSNYLPAQDVALDGKRITIRYNGHVATGTLGNATMVIDGDPMTFDTAPAEIGGKLFLPLDLYVRIGAVPLLRPR